MEWSNQPLVTIKLQGNLYHPENNDLISCRTIAVIKSIQNNQMENPMKRLCTLMVAAAFTLTVSAQAPQKMSYQAVVRNSSDALVTDTHVGMQISIL